MAFFTVPQIKRFSLSQHNIFCDPAFLDRLVRWYCEHCIHHDIFYDCSQSCVSCLSRQRCLSDSREGIPVKLELYAVKFEKLLVLLYDRALRLSKDADQCLLIKQIKRNSHRKSSHKLRDQSVFYKILGQRLMKQDIHVVFML